MDNNRRAFNFAAAGLTGLLLLTLLALGLVPGAKPTVADTGCTKGEIVEYALLAPSGSNQFGPAITDLSQKGGTDRFALKNCTSPMFAATSVAFVNDGLNLNASNVRAEAQRFKDDRGAWQQALKGMQDKISKFSVRDNTSTYQTLAMVPQGTDWPRLIKADRDIPVGQVLVAHLKDGSEREFRYGCDLQPVAPRFPNVPKIDEAPPATVPTTAPPVVTTPPQKPTTTVPGTTPTTKPPVVTTVPPSTTTTVLTCPPGQVEFEGRCVKVGVSDGVGGNTRPVTQPVAEHPQGSSPGATVFAPTPPPQVRPIGDPNGGSGSGGAPPATGPTDNSDAGQTTPPAAVGGPAGCNPTVAICP